MSKGQAGFTFIELLVVIGIVAITATLSTVILIRPQVTASVDTTVTTLIADIAEQQLKAVIGDSQGSSTSQPFGVYFEPKRYTLFRGASFTPGDPANFVVELDPNISLLNITLPNPLVFTKRSGEVSGFAPGTNSLAVASDLQQEQKTLTISRLGKIDVN